MSSNPAYLLLLQLMCYLEMFKKFYQINVYKIKYLTL